MVTEGGIASSVRFTTASTRTGPSCASAAAIPTDRIGNAIETVADNAVNPLDPCYRQGFGKSVCNGLHAFAPCVAAAAEARRQHTSLSSVYSRACSLRYRRRLQIAAYVAPNSYTANPVEKHGRATSRWRAERSHVLPRHLVLSHANTS